MESMERIDVLKGIEQILVQKAYEAGHISHRADGDWQKQAGGSWIHYKGQSDQSTPQTQEPTENTEYGEMSPKQLTRHLLKNGDYDSAIKQIDFEEDDDGVPFTYDDNFELIVDNVMNDMGMSDEERKVNRGAVSRAIMDRALQLRKPAEYGEITEEDLVEEEDAPDGEDDWDRYDDITDMIQNTDWESIVAEYDNPSVDQIMSDYDFPDDERIRDEISTYIHTDDFNEDLDTTNNVEKSAIRDMRSAPTTKNMGF